MYHSTQNEFEPRDSVSDPAYDGAIDELLPLAYEDRSIAAQFVTRTLFERRFPIISLHHGVLS